MLHSREGSGTTVEFSILACPGNEHQVKDENSQRKKPVCDKTNPAHILVVEDENINAMVIVAMLSNLGHKVTHADSGREAIRLAQSSHFDCILMDIQMPELDGVETAKIIRDSCRGTNSNTPIIAVTAHAMKGDRENFLAAGMDEYLTKPVDAATLADTLDLILGSGND